jgi:aspartate aminotransferase-like enzyme
MGSFRGERLFTPGPVELPDRVREVLGRQIIHHRTPEFTEAFLQVRELFKRFVGEDSDNFVFFSSSGTGAMEAALQNFFGEGEKVIVVVGGKFGERWLELSRAWGLEPVPVEVEWGKSVDPSEIESLIKKHPDTAGVLMQMSESSTGAFHDVYEVGRILRDKDVLLVVDAITALGVYDLKPSEIGIDVLVGGSQKALMLPPGLSILWFSEKAFKRAVFRGYYFSIKRELPKQKEGQTAWTPAIPLILALGESLKILLKEGVSELEKRYRALSRAMTSSLRESGIKILPEKPSISLTALEPPDGVDADALRKRMLDYGVRTAGGQGILKGKIVRISHMGIDPFEMTVALGALELALKDLGYKTAESLPGIYLNYLSEYLGAPPRT